jgi:hypothetical protein
MGLGISSWSLMESGTGSTAGQTFVQNGLNTYTGGTPIFPTVNVSALTVDSIIVTGSTPSQITNLLVDSFGYIHEDVIDYIGFEASAEGVDISSGTSVYSFRMPYKFTLNSINAYLKTPGSTTTSIDINSGGTSILSSNINLTSGISNISTDITVLELEENSLITLDIDSAGTNAKGLKIWFIGTRKQKIYTGTTDFIYDVIGMAGSDETTALSAATSLVSIEMPYDFVITAITAYLGTSGSTSSTIDINYNGTSILSSAITISAGEYLQTNTNISTSSLLENNILSMDIDSAGTGAKGLKVWFKGLGKTANTDFYSRWNSELSWNYISQSLGGSVTQQTESVVAGINKLLIPIPGRFNVTGVTAYLSSTGSTSTVIDVNLNTASILNSPLTIPAGQLYSATTNINATYSALTEDNFIYIDVDSAGTGAKGLKVWLEGWMIDSIEQTEGTEERFFFESYSGANISITAGWTNVAWNNHQLIDDEVFFHSHSGTSEEILVFSSGTYNIIGQIAITNNTNNNTSVAQGKIQVYTASTYYDLPEAICYTVFQGTNTTNERIMTMPIGSLVRLPANSRIKFQARRIAGTGDVNITSGGTNIRIIRFGDV